MSTANKKLCKELYDATGWHMDKHPQDNAWEEVSSTPYPKYIAPKYDLSYLVDKALETGHIHVKIKKGENGIVVTAPPCYHIEAKTPADGVAKLLIRSVKKEAKNGQGL